MCHRLTYITLCKTIIRQRTRIHLRQQDQYDQHNCRYQSRNPRSNHKAAHQTLLDPILVQFLIHTYSSFYTAIEPVKRVTILAANIQTKIQKLSLHRSFYAHIIEYSSTLYFFIRKTDNLPRLYLSVVSFYHSNFDIK